MTNDRARVPPHLDHLRVDQNYAAYTDVDHAVWRFVMLQLREHLEQRAHPLYLQGLQSCGILQDRIPRIEDIDAHLARFGWGAMCVDGFIPPRAFAQLQACGMLAIAADIRSYKHVEYTPAPDIIHEAAGHAPILVDADYSAYLRRFGEVSSKSFGKRTERRLDDAIHQLSAVKERRSSTPEDLACAEAELAAAQAEARDASETARLARLYWWTAEYGLIGSLSDFRLYGAGLLSSLGESYSCASPAVRKVWLDPTCTGVAYDITKPQPQLFVTPTFPHLMEVLAQVECGLAYHQGGDAALLAAVASEETATVVLEGGLSVVGVLEAFGQPREGRWLRFATGCHVAEGARTLWGPAAMPVLLPVGRFTVAGTATQWSTLSVGSTCRLDYANGARVEGTISGFTRNGHGETVALQLVDCRITTGDGQRMETEQEVCLPAARAVETAFGGTVLTEPSTVPSAHRTRTPDVPSPEFLRLNALYQSARTHFLEAPSERTLAAYTHIHHQLQEQFPDDWLLRWNLLESLRKLGQGAELQAALTQELNALEIHFDRAKPIDTGLRYLDRYHPARHHSLPSSGVAP